MNVKSANLLRPGVWLLAMLASPISCAGQLDKFEDRVGKKYASASESGESSCRTGAFGLDCMAYDMTSSITSQLFSAGWRHSFYRVENSLYGSFTDERGEDAESEHRRRVGEPLIPFIRVDGSYQNNDGSVTAHDKRLEAGFGGIALGYQQTLYDEQTPSDSLEISRVYGLYRMSLGSLLEFDLGLGVLEVNGNERKSYSYITMPILFHASKRFGVEFRPSWAGNVSDYDVSVLVKAKYVAAKLGYRKLSAGSELLAGPYIGLSAYF